MRGVRAIAIALMIVVLAPVGQVSAADFSQYVSLYRTCWTMVQSIAAGEDFRPSSDRWDFLLRHRDAVESMGDIGCAALGFVRPTKDSFTHDRLKPYCNGKLKITDGTEWHEAFNGPPNRPVGWPIYTGCIWYHRSEPGLGAER